MAFLDYGALLSINGKFINKNHDLFMDMNYELGFCANCYDVKQQKNVSLNGNFFVYAGDKDLFFCFYKTSFFVVKNRNIIFKKYGTDFISEVIKYNEFPEIFLKHLDPTLYFDQGEKWEEVVKENQLLFNKNLNKIAKYRARIKKNGGFYKYRNDRFFIKWIYKGDLYEVIFGYGIDPCENVWGKIKNKYGFSLYEIELINDWFKNR